MQRILSDRHQQNRILRGKKSELFEQQNFPGLSLAYPSANHFRVEALPGVNPAKHRPTAALDRTLNALLCEESLSTLCRGNEATRLGAIKRTKELGSLDADG